MLSIIKEWVKTATNEEIMELQQIAKTIKPTELTKKVIWFLNEGSKLEAIKWVKDTMNIGLKEAKDIVDEIQYKH